MHFRIQDQYSERFPRGLNPVQLNDVFFACHATFATIITICQCFAYDVSNSEKLDSFEIFSILYSVAFAFQRADQRVSIVARSILTVFAVIGVVSIVLVTTKVIYWLDVLYICSYIKLSITLIKYMPQASHLISVKSSDFFVLNFRVNFVLLNPFFLFKYRHTWTTLGRVQSAGASEMFYLILPVAYWVCFKWCWMHTIMVRFEVWTLYSITNWIFSSTQFIFSFFNRLFVDDWASIFGDPTKFGLGAFSVLFDILFLMQHYVFYRFVHLSKLRLSCDSCLISHFSIKYWMIFVFPFAVSLKINWWSESNSFYQWMAIGQFAEKLSLFRMCQFKGEGTFLLPKKTSKLYEYFHPFKLDLKWSAECWHDSKRLPKNIRTHLKSS